MLSTDWCGINEAMASILLAEADHVVAASLTRGLEANGLSAAAVPDGHTAAERARAGRCDLLLLNADALAVVRELRADGITLPVVMLAAKDELGPKVTALRAGADDYLARPFHLAELIARIHARLRESAYAQNR